MSDYYIAHNGKAKKIPNLYVGYNGKAKKVNKVYFDEFFGDLIEERKQRDDLSHDIENFITKPIVFQEGDIKHD